MNKNYKNRQISEYEILAENRDIVCALKQNGFTQKDLAVALGVSSSKVSRLLRSELQYNDQKKWIMDTIERMAEWKNTNGEHREAH